MAKFDILLEVNVINVYIMNKNIKIALIVFAALVIVVFVIRIVSGEDNWICDNGQCVKHGQPTAECTCKSK